MLCPFSKLCPTYSQSPEPISFFLLHFHLLEYWCPEVYMVNAFPNSVPLRLKYVSCLWTMYAGKCLHCFLFEGRKVASSMLLAVASRGSERQDHLPYKLSLTVQNMCL